ncbi:hypothetical protein EDB84DRAFT_1467255, partial [Lactarius hengduanensis]
VLLYYIFCIFTTFTITMSRPFPSRFREYSVVHLVVRVCVPDHAALVCSLNGSDTTCSRPQRQPVRSYRPRGSMHVCFRVLSTTRPG